MIGGGAFGGRAQIVWCGRTKTTITSRKMSVHRSTYATCSGAAKILSARERSEAAAGGSQNARGAAQQNNIVFVTFGIGAV